MVVPIRRIKTWNKLEKIAKDIAKLMEVRWSERYVSTMSKEKRKNKIFIDYFRNKKGATSVAPYSIRARKGGYVSIPISWNELNDVKPNGITMQDAIKRLKRKDPWENFFEINQ